MNPKTTVQKNISIRASAQNVWFVLTDPVCMSEWLSDSALTIESEWKIGSAITFSGKWHGITYQDRGTILELEKEKILKYNHWTRISRLPDEPQNRTLMCFVLSPDTTGVLLELTHSNLVALAAWEHSDFYWNVTLEMIRNMAENKTAAKDLMTEPVKP